MANQTTTPTGKEKWFDVKFIRRYFPVVFLIFLCLVFGILKPRFFTVSNVMIIFTQLVTTVIATMGTTFVIMAGSIDLSIGSVLALSAVASALTVPYLGVFAIIPAILTGICCGFINGFVFAKGKVPSFIVTLGGMTIYRGLVLIITKGRPIQINDQFFLKVFASRTFNIPNAAVFALIVIIISYIIFNKTPFGRETKAIGGGERVAALTGIKVTKVKIMIYMLAGAFYGVAGLLHGARVMAATATIGEGFEMDVIASIVVGGTPLTGGVGSVLGTVLGTFIITVLSNGMNMLGLSPYVQSIAKGIVLVLAVFVTIDRNKISINK